MYQQRVSTESHSSLPEKLKSSICRKQRNIYRPGRIRNLLFKSSRHALDLAIQGMDQKTSGMTSGFTYRVQDSIERSTDREAAGPQIR